MRPLTSLVRLRLSDEPKRSSCGWARRPQLSTRFSTSIRLRVKRKSVALSPFCGTGNAWYRIFQGSWRSACATHRLLDRSKVKKPASTRLSELERLHKLLRDTKQWKETAEFRTALGPFYSDGEPEFDNALRLAKWHATARARFISVGLDPQNVGILNSDEARLAKLGSLHPELTAAITALQQLQNVLQSRFGAAAAVQRSLQEANNLRQRIEIAQAVNQNLETAVQCSIKWGPASLTGLEIVRAVQARAALPGALAAVAADEPARRLLGDRYLEADTDLEPALAALMYGRNVLEARLPAPITKVLSERHGDGKPSNLAASDGRGPTRLEVGRPVQSAHAAIWLLRP